MFLSKIAIFFALTSFLVNGQNTTLDPTTEPTNVPSGQPTFQPSIGNISIDINETSTTTATANVNATAIANATATTTATTTTSSPLPNPVNATWTLTGTWTQFLIDSGRFMSFSIATDDECEMVRFMIVCPAGDWWCGFGIGGKYDFGDSGSEEHHSDETASSGETDRRRLSYAGRRLLAPNTTTSSRGMSTTSSHHGEEEGLEMNGYALMSSADNEDMWESTLEPGATPMPQDSQDLDSCTVQVIDGLRESICYRKYKTSDTEDFRDFAFGRNAIIFAIGNVTGDGVLLEHAPGDENRHYDAMFLDGDEDDQCGFAGSQIQDEKDKDKENEAWFITGIVFICAFGLLLIAVIAWFVYQKYYANDHKYEHARGGSHPSEQQAIRQTDD